MTGNQHVWNPWVQVRIILAEAGPDAVVVVRPELHDRARQELGHTADIVPSPLAPAGEVIVFKSLSDVFGPDSVLPPGPPPR